MVNLTERFYDLVNDGFIYDTDENGFNMSYGEYAAVAEHLQDCALECITGDDFRTDLEAMYETLESADDDTRMFMGDYFFDDFYDFYNSIEFDDFGEYDGGYKRYGHTPCPEYLKEQFERFTEIYAEVA